jgi:16S rRNA processing protein RimM
MTVLVASKDTTIYLGCFVKAFGIKGELKFVGSDNFWPDTLGSARLELRRLIDGKVESRTADIAWFRPHGNNFVVKLEGVESRDDTDSEIGTEVFIDTAELDVDLPERELPFQVVGFTVKTEDGREVGRVRSVIFSAAHPVYDIESDTGDSMVPAVPEFVVGRDDEAGVVTIRPIPGLLDG